MSVTMAQWMEDPKNIQKGDAERISKAWGQKYELDKKVQAQLQKIEDYYVYKRAADNDDDIQTAVNTEKILVRQVGTAIRSTWKINTDSMKNWFKIYRSFKPQSINDVAIFNQLIQKINNYKKNGKNLSTAIIDWSREFDSKPLWYADFTYWINGSKGTRIFPFYLRQSKFPSYEQWAKDMSLANFDKINQTEYNLQRYYWETFN